MREFLGFLADQWRAWRYRLPSGRIAMRREVVLIAVAALVGVFALLLLTRSGREDAPPADQLMDFHCTACGQDYRLSQREFERIWDRHEYQINSDARGVQFRCPKCGKLSARRASPAAQQANPSP